MSAPEPLALSAGARLSAARLRAGLSLATLSERYKIPRATLEALEADNLDVLPAPVYVRGFIRLYCQEVGLDAVPVLEAYDEARRRWESTQVSSRRVEHLALAHGRSSKLGPRVTIALVALAIGGALWFVLFRLSSEPTPALDAPAPVAPAAPFEPTRAPDASAPDVSVAPLGELK